MFIIKVCAKREGVKRGKSGILATCETREEARKTIIRHMDEAYRKGMHAFGMCDRKSEENGNTFTCRILPVLIFDKPISYTYTILEK